MTRDIDWGIPVPIDGWREQPTKRLYVWFDAVIGYLSASIEWARRRGEPERWRDWWNDPEALSYYFMGKDNIVFHSQIWPAELIAYNGEGSRGGEPGEFGRLNLPTEVVSSEFMTMESKQFSTSRGHVILVGDLLARYQPDALRYFICAAGPETSDADFTWADFVQRTNSELVAGWGNLVNRTATMIAKSFGEIPPAADLEPVDEAVLAVVRAGFDTVGDLLGRHRQRAAVAEAMRVVGEVNKYLTATEPYKMKGDDERVRLGTVLHVAAQCVLDCNTLLSPFLPHSSTKVWQALGGQGGLPAAAAHRLRRGAGPRRRGRAADLPRHHRRLRRHAALGDPAGDRRREGRAADPDLHQARPVGGRRGARPAGGVVRVLVVGASGRLGTAVVAALGRPARGGVGVEVGGALRRPHQPRLDRRPLRLGRAGRRRRVHGRQDAVRSARRALVGPVAGRGTGQAARPGRAGPAGPVARRRRRFVHPGVGHPLGRTGPHQRHRLDRRRRRGRLRPVCGHRAAPRPAHQRRQRDGVRGGVGRLRLDVPRRGRPSRSPTPLGRTSRPSRATPPVRSSASGTSEAA